jgi:murein DD-endopeptidase MepM/ murein hydrolase activator NlpD
LDGSQLTPKQAATWSDHEIIEIGSLAISLISPQENQVIQKSQSTTTGAQPGARLGMSAIISSAGTIPNSIELGIQPTTVGSDPTCTLRIVGGNVAPHHCFIQLKNGQVKVTNLDINQPAELGGDPLTVGQPSVWSENQTLQINDVFLSLSYRQATSAVGSGRTMAPGARRGLRGLWRWGFLTTILGGMAILCLATIAIIGITQSDCDGFDLSCLFSFLGSNSEGSGSANASGIATPTLQPTSLAGVPPTRAETILFETTTPVPTITTTTECISGQSAVTGWLEIPFPYQGTEELFGGSADGFRRISQRSRFGGRINSFFDHQYPVYPPAFGGREPQELADSLIIFNGSESPDGFAQDSDSADWYSGHSGIDYSPAVARQATTPILAAAAGRLYLAKIDSDGNHMVWLEHDPDGDNRFQYATLYFHLTPDDVFSSMVFMEEGTEIRAGQRIGTMGTTGRSTGVHLHFEVRKDLNNDGRFSIFERVDPYGFFPTERFPVDPWAELIEWIDTRGNEIKHGGIVSEYLWRHPLVEIEDTTTDCIEIRGEQVGLSLYPTLGFAVINPGFTYIAGRDERGEVLREGPPTLRRIVVLPENLEGVEFDTIRLEFLDPVLDSWRAVNPADASFELRDDGSYVYSALLRNTGRYVLVGEENIDRVSPITSILLSGERQSGGTNVFNDSVEVTLVATDMGFITSDIKETQYSLDCGKSWTVYSVPFSVTADTPHSCGEEAESSETITLGQNVFLLLAMSEDSENNIEQPSAQVRFTINE